jgi:RNA polymerase-associated protein CTR9
MRLAIGQSHLRLGNDQAAQMAFERVLQSNPKSIAALVSLAVLFINRGASSLAQGLQLLKQAYDLDRQNPTVLFHLSNHFFFKKDYIKSLSLAQSALSNAGADDVKRAEALYMIGKIHHVQGNFEESFLYYSEAAKLHPNLVLAQLGLGQICLHKGDLTSAADCFERVVELERTAGHTINDADFWAMMGTATLSDPNRSGAEKLLKKAVALGGRSFDLFLAMAMLFEGRDPVEATNAYRQAAQIDAARFNSDPELLNNYAVVLHLTGALEEAYQVLANIAKLPLGPEMIAVCRFNEARLLEDMGRLSDAESIYKELVATNPNDVALYLRLGIICARRSQHGEAAEHYKEAIGLDDTNTAAWLLLAGNHLRVKAVTPARKAYERILKANDRHDQFALTALGNIYVEIARHERNPTTVRENLRRALEFFIKALQVQCQNYVAANGVGVVLAELGRFKDAKEVFLQVRQTAPKFTDATLNLAHCFVEMGQHGAAVNAYESLEDGKVGVLLFLARAYYIHAKAERDPAAFKVAIGYLERAAQILPNDAPIKFNIGLCQQEVAAAMLKRTADLGEDGDKAMMLVEAAHRTFTELSELESKPEAVDMKIVAQRLKYCNTLVASLKSRLETLKVTSNDRQVKLDAVRIQREEQLEAERERKRRDEEARRMEQARNEEIRKELAAKLRVTEERVKAADAVGDEVSEDERPVKRKRHGERRKLENVEDVGDEEEHVSRGRRSHLSKDIISSSDEEKE